MARLKPRLARLGISDTDLWKHIKDSFSVSSRSHLSAIQWAIISARLNAAYRDPKILKEIVETITP
ncbi:hypothetical protein F4Z99_12730 [Candidatus Poribacteria bacterium]|nr:hypothetical protein [Candidatus Poribacteria bacterium]MYB02516.1 hypothetical protein [Candidatus Poribacteria bacterium]